VRCFPSDDTRGTPSYSGRIPLAIPNEKKGIVMKIIALEEGYLIESALNLMTTKNQSFQESYDMRASASIIGADPIKAYLDIGEGRIGAMDEAGIDMNVLSLSCPQIPDLDLAIKITTEANNKAAEAVKKYPTRFAAFAALPCTDPRAAVKEFDRAVNKLDFVGGFVCGSINGEFFDQKKYWPILEFAEAHNVPIYLHPFFPLSSVAGTYLKDHEELLGPVWGFMIDASCHFMRMLGGGVFDAFPKLKVILGHLGESIPYNMDRLNNHLLLFTKEKKFRKTPTDYIRDNLVVTTSGNFSVPSLLCAAGTIGVDNILFSVDWPDELNTVAVDFLKHLPLGEPDIEKIAHRNAERVLRLKK